MRGITYKNTLTNLPNWNPNDEVHLSQPIGFAYETSTHFIHIYGSDKVFNIISIGLTVAEAKSGTLEDWVITNFGATTIEPITLDIGSSISGVWRPSLYYYEDSFQALNVSDTEMRLSEQALRILIEKLDELLLYIEPDANGLNSHSHKTRELLILASTEVENYWKYYMDISSAVPQNGRTFTTNDYVRLLPKLHLDEFEFNLKSYPHLPAINPFLGWSNSQPSQSLTWYDAYNKTKHDRDSHFDKSTLSNAISSVIACLVLHCVKFSPFPLFEQNNALTSLINQHFSGNLVVCNNKSYYIPEIELPSTTRADKFVFDPRREGYTKPFNVNSLTI